LCNLVIEYDGYAHVFVLLFVDIVALLSGSRDVFCRIIKSVGDLLFWTAL